MAATNEAKPAGTRQDCRWQRIHPRSNTVDPHQSSSVYRNTMLSFQTCTTSSYKVTKAALNKAKKSPSPAICPLQQLNRHGLIPAQHIAVHQCRQIDQKQRQ